MNPRMIRMRKEARALFWPWCAVVVAGAAPLIVAHSYSEPLSFVSFFLGVPLLATLALGNEFHHRTISLWLTQPLSRTQLWREKVVVMAPAVLSAGVVSGVVMFSVTWPHMRVTYKIAAAAYVIATMASAPLWTLTTKSTLGGLALLSGILFFGSLFSGGVDPGRRGEELNAVSFAGAIAVLIVGTLFAAVMLWLGVRRLIRFELAGGSAEGDLLMAGSAWVPETLAAWSRSRPRGAIANLIRKEFRLLRPLWLVGLVVFLYVLILAIFRLLPAPPVLEPRTVLEWTLWGPLISVCIAMAGLAGALSLGEEKTSGTHAWQMTLPVSARLQWLIKLIIAMFAGLACSILFPLIAMVVGGAIHGSPLMYVNIASGKDDLILFAILSFTYFWCACAVNGTVRAALWAAPVTAAIALTCAGGIQLGEKLANSTGTLKDFIVSRFHLNPLALETLADFGRSHVLWLFVPTLLFSLAQSYFLFRTPPSDGILRMLRSVLPVAAMTILWSFSVSGGLLFTHWRPFDEVQLAIDQFQPAAATLELTGDDLARASFLTAPTRRWLNGAAITVSPRHTRSLGYVARIHLASGMNCSLTVAGAGGKAASCGD